jgi:hypothetical protein
MRTDPYRASEEVCIANISTDERRKRLFFGLVSLLAGLALLALMVALRWNRLYRLALLPLFIGATYGYFQWREKT